MLLSGDTVKTFVISLSCTKKKKKEKKKKDNYVIDALQETHRTKSKEKYWILILNTISMFKVMIQFHF